MIKLFAYENKEHQKSIKIVGVTGDNGRYFGGISLGKVVYNSEESLDVVLEALKNYAVLDHLPRRGEGLNQFNECYKMFNHDSVYCQLGELDPNKITASDLEKTIKFLKEGLNEKDASDLFEEVREAADERKVALARMPSELIAILAIGGAGTWAAEAEAEREVLIDNDSWYTSTGTPMSTYMSSSPKEEKESDVIKNLRALARSLGYDIVKL